MDIKKTDNGVLAANTIFPQVSVIPATKRSIQSGGQLNHGAKLRVAAYCRVSTGDESQQTSYTGQKTYYAGLIRKKEGWSLAGIYADEAISGTSRSKRKEFNKMMQDALDGKLDYIVTKSISRFARNTVDTLNCVRQLRQLIPPIGIFFEKENIDTLDARGELILTILSALAQEESRSISDNIRWTFQKNFKEGKPHLNLKRMIGYDPGPNGKWIINREQAEIVRTIFERYLKGDSACQIARMLNEKGMKTVNGNIWRSDSIYNILRNEKYVGDLEMQKTVTRDFLTHRSVMNNGEAPKYYVTNHHVGIVDRMTWNRAKAMLAERKKRTKEVKENRCGVTAAALSNLICGCCGARYSRTTYTARIFNYSDERCFAARGEAADGYKEIYSYAYPLWRCKEKYSRRGKNGRLSYEEKKAADKKCTSGVLHEEAIEQSFMEMIYQIKQDYEINGKKSRIEQMFLLAYQTERRKNRGSCFSAQRLELIEMQILELEKNLPSQSTEILQALEERKMEKNALEVEQNIETVMKRNYDLFLNCLMKLPEKNRTGVKLNVNKMDAASGLLTQHSAVPPDYLEFSKEIYLSFFSRGIVKGDEIVFITNFGVKLTSSGNKRGLAAFLGYRQCREDGTIEILTDTYQVGNRKIRYRRVENKKKERIVKKGAKKSK